MAWRSFMSITATWPPLVHLSGAWRTSPLWTKPARPCARWTVKHPFAVDHVWLYGFKAGGAHRIPVDVGGNKVTCPATICDRPIFVGCQSRWSNAYMHVMYVTGFTDPRKIPPALLIGSLKYIAHLPENPGDLVKTVSASGASNQSTGLEAGDPVRASGAGYIWRSVNPNAI
jgi:hypothetical protein